MSAMHCTDRPLSEAIVHASEHVAEFAQDECKRCTRDGVWVDAHSPRLVVGRELEIALHRRDHSKRNGRELDRVGGICESARDEHEDLIDEQEEEKKERVREDVQETKI
jgi:hypothetical protein